jgi:hypothetical protein
MHDYRKIAPAFWNGETGRRLRQAGRDVQLVALYLVTCPASSMIGLYHLELPLLCCHTGLDEQEALKALRRASEAGFCEYDENTEVVWVPKMAAHQIGARLAAADNRVKNVARELARFRKSRFFNDFLHRYGVAYHLLDQPELKPVPSPSEGASKPLRSQEQEQEQEQESLAADKPPHANCEPRKRNELWDAVVKITGADETLSRTKGLIGKVCKELKTASPPYTAEDVLALPQAIRRAGMDFKITVGSIPNHIHLVRAKPSDQPGGTAAGFFAGRKET